MTVLKVPLRGVRGRGRFTLVDVEDAAIVAKHKWWLNTNGYAFTSIYIGKSNSTTVYLHQMILKPEEGKECDHINRDKLDNRRSNLRRVVHAENCKNRFHPLGESGVRGVCLHKPSGLWRVRLRENGREISGGYFRTKQEAVAQAFTKRRNWG